MNKITQSLSVEQPMTIAKISLHCILKIIFIVFFIHACLLLLFEHRKVFGQHINFWGNSFTGMVHWAWNCLDCWMIYINFTKVSPSWSQSTITFDLLLVIWLLGCWLEITAHSLNLIQMNICLRVLRKFKLV